MAVFILQWQSWVVSTENIWSSKPKTSTICPFIEKFAQESNKKEIEEQQQKKNMKHIESKWQNGTCKFHHINHYIKCKWGLPWWCRGWESACQCRGHGFEPWSGKIPHAAEQLGPRATIAESARLEPVLHNKRGRDSERPVHRNEEWPPLAAIRESPRTETKTQHSHK